MRITILGSLCFLATAALADDLAKPPRAERRPVADTYQGEQVTDPYRWLEQDAPETRAWVEQQAAFARRTLGTAPARKQIEARVRQVMRDFSPSYLFLQKRAGLWFALKLDRRKNQPMLVTLTRLDGKGKERTLLDPNRLDPSGRTTIDFYEATENGGQLAVSLSRLGTESGDVHVYDVSTGRERAGDVVPRVNGGTAGGSVAWQKDGSGFFYTRYPRGQERPPEDRGFYQQVYFHALGTPTEKDRYEMGKDLPRIAEIKLEVDDATGRVLATVQNGDGGQFAFFLRETNGDWRQFTTFKDPIVQGAFGR